MKKLIFAIAVAAAGAASAAVSFSYQGALKTEKGEDFPAEERNKTISFRLYDTPEGTEALWGRRLAVHLDDNGLFNVELSDDVGSPIKDGSWMTNNLAYVLSAYPGKDKGLYIGLDVQGSSGEIRPRQKLINVPSAAFAADVSKANGDFTVTGIATFNDAVKATNSTVTVGTLIAEKGLTVSKGNLTVSSGNLTVSSGNLTVSSGSLSVPNGGIVPKGGIIMWSGKAGNIPEGWALCDGKPHTYNGKTTTPPNLTDRFIVGAGGKYGLDTVGGNETVTLAANQMPSHDHTFQAIFHVYETEGNSTTTDYNNYGYGVRWVGTRGVDSNAKADGQSTFKMPSVGSYTLSEQDTNVKTSKSGGAESIDIRPPYYALCFIMKL